MISVRAGCAFGLPFRAALNRPTTIPPVCCLVYGRLVPSRVPIYCGGQSARGRVSALLRQPIYTAPPLHPPTTPPPAILRDPPVLPNCHAGSLGRLGGPGGLAGLGGLGWELPRRFPSSSTGSNAELGWELPHRGP